MRFFYKAFYIICGTCGHRNRPHPSPHESIRMTLTNTLPSCRGCGKQLHPPPQLSNRPLIQKVRAELIAEGIKPVC